MLGTVLDMKPPELCASLSHTVQACSERLAVSEKGGIGQSVGCMQGKGSLGGCKRLQAHLAQLALQDIFEALEVHQDQADLQAKGLVALGVLGQGDEAIHDKIRSMQLQIGVPKAIARALQQWGCSSDEVRHTVCF